MASLHILTHIQPSDEEYQYLIQETVLTDATIKINISFEELETFNTFSFPKFYVTSFGNEFIDPNLVVFTLLSSEPETSTDQQPVFTSINGNT